MKSKNNDDLWLQDDFEDAVDRAIIAQYEKKIRKNRSAFPSDRMTDVTRKMLFNRDAPYIPSQSRLFYFNPSSQRHSLDIANDPLPESGCAYFGKPQGKLKDRRPGEYAQFAFFKKIKNIPRGYRPAVSGTHYSFWFVGALDQGGIEGERFLITIDNSGETVLFNNLGLQNTRISAAQEMMLNGERYERELAAYFSIAMLQDKRFSWTITANDGQARVTLGCMEEEIKSLLYARSLPLTVTGRKRPILHLVEAHKRRLKSGIEIDINHYLRGVSDVEICGTHFHVAPPTEYFPDANSIK